MSIICALKAPPPADTGIKADTTPSGVWIGSDTQSLDGWIKEDCGPKWVQAGHWWIGAAGALRLVSLIRQRAELFDEPNVDKIATRLKQALIDDKWVLKNEPVGTGPSADLEMLITNGDRIYSVCGGFSVVECNELGVAGAGVGPARGYYLGALRGNLKPMFMVRGMIAAAIDIRADCGGDPWTQFVEAPRP